MMARHSWTVILLSGFVATSVAQGNDEALQRSVSEIRHAIGDWDVVTEFLADDGSVQKTVEGNYSFSWVVEDRVASGTNAIPAIELRSGILFYINAAAGNIEMVAVGPDGRLWIMTGPLGGSTRYSQEYPDSSGGTGQLRFTRYNVSDDGFESKMEYTDDGGETWKPGNHQVFRRAQKPESEDPEAG
jgi:hypothetical protein